MWLVPSIPEIAPFVKDQYGSITHFEGVTTDGCHRVSVRLPVLREEVKHANEFAQTHALVPNPYLADYWLDKMHQSGVTIEEIPQP